MLGKLIKQEFKATVRVFVPVYAALLMLSVINRMFVMWFDVGSISIRIDTLPDILRGILSTLPILAMVFYGLLIAALCIMVPIIAVERFSKRLLGDEGYLMFTLPVQPWKHIATRGIVSAVWMAASIFIVTLSGIIFAVPMRDIAQLPGDFIRGLVEGYRELGMSAWFYLLEGLALVICATFAFIFMLYAAISIGHLCKRHKTLGAFGAFIVLWIITQMVGTMVILGCGRMFNDMSYTSTMGEGIAMVHVILCLGTLFAALLGAVFFWCTERILTRGLNLE